MPEKAAGKPFARNAEGTGNVMAGIVARATCGVKRKGYKILWLGCGGAGNWRGGGRARSTKIFVDNTKAFVVGSAHEPRTTAKANGVRAGNPARAVGARALHGPRCVRSAA